MTETEQIASNQQFLNDQAAQQKAEQEIKEIAEKIEAYHQQNFWDCFPAGQVNPWILRAVLEQIVKPMQAQIDELSKK